MLAPATSKKLQSLASGAIQLGRRIGDGGCPYMRYPITVVCSGLILYSTRTSPGWA